MHEPLNLIIVGLGHHGRSIAALAHQAGAVIIAAADPATAGAPLAEVLGIPGLMPVVAASASEIAPEVVQQADVLVLSAKLGVDEAVAEIERTLVSGVNVVTIIEQLFDPADFTAEQRARLETAALAGRATYFATGCQDVMWLGMAALAVGGARNLRSVTVTQRFGVDGYPVPFVQGELGAGLAAHEFAAVAEEAMRHPAVLGSVLPLLARHLRLEVSAQRRAVEPVHLQQARFSESLGREIAVGEAIGSRDETVLESAQGITLRAVLETTAVPPGGENDLFELVVDADPVIRLTHLMDPGPACVDATVINRLWQVRDAAPGIVTTFDLPFPTYR